MERKYLVEVGISVGDFRTVVNHEVYCDESLLGDVELELQGELIKEHVSTWASSEEVDDEQ